MNVVRLSLAAIVLAGFAILTGCTPTYHPNAVTTPMLQEKGEVQAGGMITTDGVDTQVAVAVTDRIGVVGAYSYGVEEDYCILFCDLEDDVDLYFNHFVEGGIGYTVPATELFSAELYGGYGYGWTEAVDEIDVFDDPKPYPDAPDQAYVLEGQFQRFYLQPGGFLKRDRLKVGVASRFSVVHFLEIDTPERQWRGSDARLFWEPALTFRYTLSPVIISAQSSLVYPAWEGQLGYDYQRIVLSAGLHLRLDDLFR